MPRVTKVKKARRAQGTCGKCSTPIKVGDPYLWWKFRRGARHVRCVASACAPKGSDLTQSEYLGAISDIQDRYQGCCDTDELTSIAEDLRALGEEQLEKLGNMPGSLQESDTGQLLQERAEQCEAAADEIESFISDVESEWPESWDDHPSKEDWEDEDEYEQARVEYIADSLPDLDL